MTGYKRDGYCRTGPDDPGNHSVAGIVTDEFLEFSASQGNDLRKQAGLQGKPHGTRPSDPGPDDALAGSKWCLCASRWKEAMEANKSGRLSNNGVPRVFLHATGKSALDSLSMSDLREFAAEGEAPNQVNRQNSHIDPSSRTGAAVKEV